jgi:hypothetical protein
MKSAISRIGVGCLSLVFIAGCAKYTPHPLQAPGHVIPQEKNNVEIAAAPLTEFDCKNVFSRRILAKGYQPIQLMIKNKSRFTYILDSANIDMQIEPSERVAKQLHLNTEKRVISWLIPAIFIWPFIIPAMIEGLKSSQANKDLNHDFDIRTLGDDSRIYINPGCVMNKVMFVNQENYRQSFDLYLFSKEQDELLRFTVKV